MNQEIKTLLAEKATLKTKLDNVIIFGTSDKVTKNQADKALIDAKTFQNKIALLDIQIKEAQKSEADEQKETKPKKEVNTDGLEKAFKEETLFFKYQNKFGVQKTQKLQITKEIKQWSDKLQNKVSPGLTSNIGGDDATMPVAISRTIVRLLEDKSDILSAINLSTTFALSFKEAMANSTVIADWTDEGDSAKKDTPTTGVFTLGAHGLKKILEVSNEILDYATTDFISWALESFTKAFKTAMEIAFIKGDGQKKPLGFTKDDKVTQGHTLATRGKILQSDVKKTFWGLKENAKNNASFIMSPEVYGEILDLKGTDGHFIYEEERKLSKKTGYSLKGYPVLLTEYMANLKDAGKVVLWTFADLKEYRANVGRQFTIQESGHSAFEKDLHQWRGTTAVDGKVRNTKYFYHVFNKA